MFKIERIRQIKEILKDCRQIEVSALSSLLNVSDATIRSDLEELEKEGFLTRFHGGATLNTQEQKAPVVISGDPPVEYDKNKEDIGIIAARFIHEREWVFLGPGTTTCYIARALCQRSNISILTNSFLAANVLRNAPNIKTVFLGGSMERQGFYTVPDDLEKELHNIYLDKAFFSVDGIDLAAGYTLSDIPVLETIQLVKKQSRETIMAVDTAKFGQRAFRKVCGINDITTIITNPDIPESYRRYFPAHGIRAYTTLDLKPLSC